MADLIDLRQQPPSGLRLLVCDDHRVLADGLAAYLTATPGIASVAVTYAGEQAVRAISAMPVDLLLLDLSLGGQSEGLDVLEAIRHRKLDLRILIVSGTRDPRLIAQALDLGADGFIGKDVGPAALRESVLRVAAGQVELPSEVVRSVVHELRVLREHNAGVEQTLARLSPREQQALRLLAVGKGTREIASDLGVSINTVRTHLAHVMAKLGVHSQLEAAARGRELFTVPPDARQRHPIG